MAIFGPKPWVNPFGKMSIFRLFELLVFITVAHKDKTLPRFQNTSQNPKTLPRIQNTSQNSKNTSQNPKHFTQSKNTSQNLFWTLFGFWEVFLDSGTCFGFWEVFLDSGTCFGIWEVFCPYKPP